MNSQKIKMSEEGQTRLLLELAQQYGTNPMNAFKEFTTNAIDAIKDGSGRGDIHIKLEPNTYRIMIQDDAIGMTPGKLKSLPVSVGESAKKDKIDQRGEKAVGLLAFGSLGKRMYIFSRGPGIIDYDNIMYEISNSNELMWKPGSLSEKDMGPLGGPFSKGTRIVLNVDQTKFNQKFKSKEVRREIQEIYWPILDSEDINFYLQRGEEEPASINTINPRGEIVYDESIEFTTKKKGEDLEHKVHVKLWFDNKTDAGKVSLYSKGVRVHKSLSDLENQSIYDSPLWNCNQIKGYVDEPNLTLTLGRDKVNEQKDSNAYRGFISALSQLNDKLWPDIEKRISRRNLEKNDEILNSAYDQLKYAFQNNGLTPLNSTPRKEPTGEGIPWGTPTKTENPEDDTGNENNSDGDNDPTRKRKWPFGSIESVAFGIDERQYRSKLELRLGGKPGVSINNKHPDYINIVNNKPNSDEAMHYLVSVMSTQMAWWESEQAIRGGKTFNDDAQRYLEVSRRAHDLTYSTLMKKGK